MQILDPAYHSGVYRLAVESGSRNREAAFELALKSATPFSVGDRVSYYITAGKGPSYDRARLASDWNPRTRDEDVRYYLKQLEDTAKLFDGSLPLARGRAYFYNSQNLICLRSRLSPKQRQLAYWVAQVQRQRCIDAW